MLVSGKVPAFFYLQHIQTFIWSIETRSTSPERLGIVPPTKGNKYSPLKKDVAGKTKPWKIKDGT